MVPGSVALVFVAGGLWIAGLRVGTDAWYYASIVASALAALALVSGVRQRVRAAMPEDDVDLAALAPAGVGADRVTGRAAVVHPRRARRGANAGADRIAAATPPEPVYAEPADEPAPERLTPDQARRVAGLTADVVVVDGRPRYHSDGCPHLVDRPTERLPVAEAVGLGFTPCGRCSPGRDLLAATPS